MKKYSTLPLILLSFFVFPSYAFAQTETEIGGCTTQLCNFGANVTGDKIGGVLGSVIQFIFVIAVILALGFLVFGGIKWLTSGGDKDGVAAARGTIIAAIVGLIIIVLSYFILNIVMLFLTGSGLNNLPLPQLTTGNSIGDGTDI